VYAFNKLLLSIVENVHIDRSNHRMAVELLKKSYVDKPVGMKTIPVTDAEIILQNLSHQKTRQVMMKFQVKSQSAVYQK
jgi:hypothetical protein